MLLAARHHTGRSMLLASLLAMCKTAGAIQCDGQTLDAANIASVQACTVINGYLMIAGVAGAVELPNLQVVTGYVEVCTVHLRTPACRDPPTWWSISHRSHQLPRLPRSAPTAPQIEHTPEVEPLDACLHRIQPSCARPSALLAVVRSPSAPRDPRRRSPPTDGLQRRPHQPEPPGAHVRRTELLCAPSLPPLAVCALGCLTPPPARGLCRSQISDNTALTSLSVPVLASVGGSFFVRRPTLLPTLPPCFHLLPCVFPHSPSRDHPRRPPSPDWVQRRPHQPERPVARVRWRNLRYGD